MQSKPPFKLFSCDTHVEHDARAWLDYVDPKYRPLVTLKPDFRVFGVMEYGGPNGIPLGSLSGIDNYRALDYGKYDVMDDNLVGCYGNSAQYVEWMDVGDVDAAVLLPGAYSGASIGSVKATGDRDAYINVVQAFNNWMSDFCSAHPDRLLGGACVPLTDMDDAIAELRRVRKLPGIGTVAPSAFPSGDCSPKREDDRFWQECLDLDMPVTFHGGISSPRQGQGIQTNWDVIAWIIGHTEVTTGGPFSATQMILSGVFDRLPDLRICLQEAGAGWLPFMMCEMDHWWPRYKWLGGMELKNPPSWYCTSGNILWNIIADAPAIRFRHEIGVDNLSWSSDFPHGNSTWPRCESEAVKLCAGIPDEERHKILWENAARFYRFEPKSAAAATSNGRVAAAVGS